MHRLLSAYILAGGEARELSEALDVPLARVTRWLRGAEIPDHLLVNVEIAAHAQVERRTAQMIDAAENPSGQLRSAKWREQLMDLDRAHWIVHGISLFEFQLRVALKLEEGRYRDDK